MPIGSERVAAVIGYTLTTGNFAETSPNLPQRIAILAEANTAFQSGLSINPVDITSAQQAGALYGYGSPIHMIMRILRPVNSDGVGGIPTIVYPQAAAVGATARIQTITVTGTATANGTHTVQVAGRTGVDGQNYSFNVNTGDTASAVAQKIADAINNVLGSPVSATVLSGVVTVTTKWAGLTSQDVKLAVSNGGAGLGVSYAVAETVAGSGTPAVTPALNSFGEAWNTIVINSYGMTSTVLDELETYNGVPSPTNPTGRYNAIIMKPFIAFTGSVLEDPSASTDTRKNNLTIAVCPAPKSNAHPMEAAANMTVLASRIWQDTPHLDVQDMVYNDMPAPDVIGAMADYNQRDVIVKKGCSTVVLNGSQYQVKDFVTTYHPTGESVPQFRFCRTLTIDFNIRFGYYLREEAYVKGHAIAGDSDIVTAKNVIKPKQWLQQINQYAEDLSQRALISDPTFMQSSIKVSLSTTNPDRLQTYFKYKRSGYLRQADTVAEAGFNFGTN